MSPSNTFLHWAVARLPTGRVLHPQAKQQTQLAQLQLCSQLSLARDHERGSLRCCPAIAWHRLEVMIIGVKNKMHLFPCQGDERIIPRNVPKSDHRQQGSEDGWARKNAWTRGTDLRRERALPGQHWRGGRMGSRYPRRHVPTPSPALALDVHPGWCMLTENPLLSLTHTLALRFAETSSLSYSPEGMVGRTRNSKDWAT